MGAAASAPHSELTLSTQFFGKPCEIHYSTLVAKDRMGGLLETLDTSQNKDDVATVLREQCEHLELEVSVTETDELTKVVVSEKKKTTEPLSTEDVDRIVHLLKAHETIEVKKQTIVVFVDGSDRAHEAYVVAKGTMKGDDQLAVVSVESEKEYLGPNYKVAAIQMRYESDLTPLLPAARWKFLTLKKEEKQTKSTVADFVNKKELREKAECFPEDEPTLVVVGFSGRKSSKDRDPSIIGQVADLSLRAVHCPIAVIKTPTKPAGQRHFVMLVDAQADSRCLPALRSLIDLLHPDDQLTLLHAQAQVSDKDLEHIQALYASVATRCAAIDFLPNDRVNWRSRTDLLLTQLNDTDKYQNVDFVCVACRPRALLGSISDMLVKKYAGNIILIKALGGENNTASTPNLPTTSPAERRPSTAH